MAVLNLGNLQALVTDYVDDKSNSYFDLTTMTLRLNLALRETQKRLISANFDYYTTCVTAMTVAGQAAYALPDDFIQIIRLDRVTQGSGVTATTQKIMPITPNQTDLVFETQAAPSYYYFQKNNFILSPVPDAIYTLHLDYSYSVADMVNSSDLPDCPIQFREYIALIVARDYQAKDGRNITNIQTKLSEYELLFKQVAVQRGADETRMVVQTGYDGW